MDLCLDPSYSAFGLLNILVSTSQSMRMTKIRVICWFNVAYQRFCSGYYAPSPACYEPCLCLPRKFDHERLFLSSRDGLNVFGHSAMTANFTEVLDHTQQLVQKATE
jgi:hypothetical protein